MKKIFYSSLMAVALLISGQVKAANEVKVTIGSTDTYYNDLASAFSSIAANQTATVTLVGDVGKMIGATPNGSMLQVTDGKKITFDLNGHNAEFYFYGINLNNGWFIITGQGTLKFSGKYSSLGTQDANYGNNYKFIGITGSTDPTKEKYSYLKIDKDVSIDAFGYGFGMLDINGCAYGAVVDCYGDMTTVWGCTINGNVQKIPGQGGVPDDAYIPEINIYSESTIVGGMYCAGYAKYYIAGTLIGSSDSEDATIYVKSGQLIIDGATITSTYSGYTEPQPSNGGAIGGAGCAIVIDAKSGYAGNVSVTVTGDAKVTATGGYALYETSTDESGTAVINNGIQIESGEFTGNANYGALQTSGEVKENVKINGGITGGTFSDDGIKDYVSNVNGVIEVVESDGETVYVVNGMEPGKTWKEDLSQAGETDFVKVSSKQVISSYKEVAYLNVPGKDTVIVRNNATLSVGEAVLGSEAVLIVEPGSKVVVKETNGVIAFEPENLIIQANEANGMGTFLINPDVKANKSPKATIEFMTSPACGVVEYPAALGAPTDYKWEMIASPFVKIDTIISEAPTAYERIEDGAFVQRSKAIIIDETEAFDMLAICPNGAPKASGYKYTFIGTLQGANDLSNCAVEKEFNYMGNAYTGKLNAKEMVAQLQETTSDVRSLVYLWDVANMKWDVYNGYKLEQLGNINPMAAFVLYSDKEGTVNLDYEELVWNANK